MKQEISYRIFKSSAVHVLMVLLAIGCVVPLLAIIFFIVKSGISHIDLDFMLHTERPPMVAGGGIIHALLGSFIVVVIAAILAIPIGVLAGVYLSEYRHTKLASATRLAVDVLQGIPSIVIGVIAYIWLVKSSGTRPAILGHSGYSGSIALAFMMLPIIIRSTEETLLMLPDSLREAGLALGLPMYKVILTIILPCGFNGIITGIILAVARVAGETAPLLFTAFGNSHLALNPKEPMETLPHIIYKYANSPIPNWQGTAWGAALVLLVWVFFLNIITKLLTARWKVQL